MAINIGALKSANLCRPARHRGGHRPVPRVRCREQGDHRSGASRMKRRTVCALAKAAGADYVKTSTFRVRRATVADVMADAARVSGRRWGIKAAGGIRNARRSWKAMVAGGATRIGTSAGVRIIQGAASAALGSRAHTSNVGLISRSDEVDRSRRGPTNPGARPEARPMGPGERTSEPACSRVSSPRSPAMSAPIGESAAIPRA